MSTEQDQYEIVIIECCENCETHQAFSRHSEWKYFQQFNEIKRKIQRFVNNAIVIKNPIPDQLMKIPELKMGKNSYINKERGEQIVFPRIGAFQIYIYNVLIYSKILSNAWPNHYKIVQIINEMIEAKAKGIDLQQFSIYRQLKQETEQKPQKQRKTASKNKRNHRVYKSKEYKPIVDSPVKKSSDLLLSQKKNVRRNLIDQEESKVKLPSLKNLSNIEKEEFEEKQEKKEEFKNIFKSLEQIEKEDLSFIQKKGQMSISKENQFQSMEFIKETSRIKSFVRKESIKFLQEKSVQYSQRQQDRDFMNQSVQFSEEEGHQCDFGVQIEDAAYPRQISFHFVQTDNVLFDQGQKQKKTPYMLDQQVQADIEIRKDCTQKQTQTKVVQFETTHTNTQMVSYVNRGYQFPESEKAIITHEFATIDDNFQHLYDKRRNIVDNKYFSIDRFEEKNTRYKWIGRASLQDNVEDMRKQFFLECLVFSVYNYYGIKTPEKRLSVQKCSNIVAEEKQMKYLDTTLVHTMTSENPQLQYPFLFEEYSPEDKKFPLSQELTFKNSKQKVKFVGYGSLLAIAYFLNDYQLFNQEHTNVGVVISNQEVKEIYKLNANEYNIEDEPKVNKRRIIIDKNGIDSVEDSISMKRLSEEVEHEFISMVSKLVSPQIFDEMLTNIRQTFIEMSPSYKTFRNSLLSMKTQSIDKMLVQQFMVMLTARKQYLQQEFKGQLYAHQKYNSLQPKIKFNIQKDRKDVKKEYPKIDRKFKYESKVVMNHDVIKHIRSKDHFVIVSGESGIGKTEFIRQVEANIKYNFSEKIKLWNITHDVLTSQSSQRKTVDTIIDDYRKQIIMIDNGEHYFMQIVQFVQKIYDKDDPRSRPQISFCMATSGETHRFKNRFVPFGVRMIECGILPLEIEEIRNYLMKSIQFHNYSDKKNFVDELVGIETVAFTEAHPKYKYISFLQNPFYLHIYCVYLSHKQDLDDFQACLLYSLNKYTLLKEVFGLCWRRHYKQIKAMQMKVKEPLHDLRKLAFEYYHSNREINETIRNVIDKYSTDEIVSNQLSFYPVDIEAGMKKDRHLFLHNQYFNFFLVEGYCYYLEKGYKYMRMNKLYNDRELLNLIKEHYSVERTHSKLLDVVYQTKKLPNTAEQASNAITLLTKIGHVFTNVNLDDVDIPQADLSSGVFYNCSFRTTNMTNAILYKSQFINCQVDSTKLDNMSVFQRKIQSQYTVLSAGLSNDSRNVALGCGNSLLIINTQTGKELKNIEAHVDVIRTVRYSRDGTSLVTIADDKTLRVWDVRSYRSVVFRLPQKGTIAYSNQTQTIASVTKNYLKVWNLKSMANQFVLEGHSDLITTIHFSLDGTYIVTGSRDTTLKLWNIKKGSLMHTYRGHSTEVISAKISPTKRLILSSSKDNDLIVWDLSSRTELAKKNYGDEVVELCIDDKEKYVVISFSKEHFISVVQISNLETVHTLYGHKSKIISINFDLFYRKLISLSKDKTVKIWQLDKIMEQENRIKANETNKFQATKGPITVLSYCKFTTRYATAHENGQINIFSGNDNRHIDQIISHNGMVKCLTFDKLGKIYAGGSDGVLRIWNLQTKREPRTIEVSSSEIIQLKLNEKSRLIATSSAANELVIYDFTGTKLVMSTREEGLVQAIQFSKDERTMAIGGSEGYVAIFQISDGGNSINRMEELGPNPDKINCMTFHSQTMLVVALRNGHVMIWNHIKSNLIKKIQNISPITTLLSFQKKYVCFGSDDGKIRIINMEEGKQIKTFRYSQITTSLASNVNQSLLYVGTKSGNLIIWNLNSIHPSPNKVAFDRVAIDKEGEKTVHVEGSYEIMIRNLSYHEQQYIELKQLESEIEGVAWHQNKVILLLKNGIHWDMSRKKEYHFGRADDAAGDLYYVRNKPVTNLFKTPIKRLKGLKKPVQNVLQQLSY